MASADLANANLPSNAVPAAKPRGGRDIYAPAGSPPSAMHPNAVTPTGGSQPHDNMQPYLTINFIIAMQGIFPSRN
jgi:microcystin-dependent protein